MVGVCLWRGLVPTRQAWLLSPALFFLGVCFRFFFFLVFFVVLWRAEVEQEEEEELLLREFARFTPSTNSNAYTVWTKFIASSSSFPSHPLRVLYSSSSTRLIERPATLRAPVSPACQNVVCDEDADEWS